MRPLSVGSVAFVAWILTARVAPSPLPRSSGLERVIPAISVQCRPGPWCAWIIAERIGLPLGVQIEADETPDSARRLRPLSTFAVSAITARELLDRVVQDDPIYEWREMGGIGVVRSRSAWTDNSDVLNRRLGSTLDLGDVALSDAIHRALSRHGVHGVEYGEQTGKGPKVRPEDRISVQVGDGPLLEAISAIARAHGNLAWCLYKSNKQDWILSLAPASREP
jgi:hypothetical protein